MGTPSGVTSQRDFRARYGDEIADLTEAHAARSGQRAGRPAMRDIKAALQALVLDPGAAQLRSIDSLTRALLMDPAWRRFRIRSLHALTRDQLIECARYALDHFPPTPPLSVEGPEVRLTLALLDAARGWHAARRIALVRAALALVFDARYERATAIIRQAHGELRAVQLGRVVETGSAAGR